MNVEEMLRSIAMVFVMGALKLMNAEYVVVMELYMNVDVKICHQMI